TQFVVDECQCYLIGNQRGSLSILRGEADLQHVCKTNPPHRKISPKRIDYIARNVRLRTRTAFCRARALPRRQEVSQTRDKPFCETRAGCREFRVALQTQITNDLQHDPSGLSDFGLTVYERAFHAGFIDPRIAFNLARLFWLYENDRVCSEAGSR